MRISPIIRSTFVLSLFTSPLVAGVIVVNPLGGGDFTSLADAVTASLDGDTILVKATDQSVQQASFVVDGKGITIVAERFAKVSLSFVLFGVNEIRNVPAGKSVVVRGVDSNFYLENNAGAVRFEDCKMTGLKGFCSPTFSLPSSPGCSVSTSASVSFVRCQLLGGPGTFNFDLFFSCCTAGGPGLKADASSNVVLYNTLTGGGAAGDSNPWCGAGAPIEAPPGVVTNLFPTHGFEISSPLRSNEPGFFRFHGPPGHSLFAVASPTTGHQLFPPTPGVLLVGAPFLAVIPLGGVGPAASVIPIAVPTLPPIGAALTFHVQGIFLNGSAATIGPPSVLTVLDPSL